MSLVFHSPHMGAQDVQANLSPEQRSLFMKALLRDVRAMELMLERHMFEAGVTRIGAEQELVLVDRDWQPAPKAMEILDQITDPRATTEVARWNIECNIQPRLFRGDSLRRMEDELREVVDLVREVSRRFGAEIVMCGILPTLAMSHMGIENISASQVSEFNKELDSQVEDFKARPLAEEYPFFCIDALYQKVRVEGRVASAPPS